MGVQMAAETTTEAAGAVATLAVEHGMTWLEFIATMFQALMSVAWPAAVVLSVWIFRNEIRPMLPMFRLKHKDTEISFRLDEAEKTVGQLPAPREEAMLAPPEEVSHFEKIAKLSPRAALLDMRREVEGVLTKEFERLVSTKPWKISQSSSLSSRQVLRALRAGKAIDPTAANLFEDVLAIGNIAAHDDNINFTFDDAVRYRNVVDHAMRFLETPPVGGPEDFPNLPPQE